MIILGLNIFHADTSASLFIDNKLIAACEEERFVKIKHFSGIPVNSIKHCLEVANLKITEVDFIAVNFNSKYNLLNKINFSVRNFNFSIIEKILSIRRKSKILEMLDKLFFTKIGAKVIYIPHHISHISSSYLCSGIKEAIGLTIDGSGDFSTAESYILKDNNIKIVEKILYPHSLGIFYQTFTQFLGFKNYGDEYKFMGLAAYGNPKYLNKLKNIIKYDEKGNFKLNLGFFNHQRTTINFQFEEGIPLFTNFYNQNFIEFFGKERSIDEKITQYHKDLAASVQKVFEDIILNKLIYLSNKYKIKNLILSGGCFFNSVLNGKIHNLENYKSIFISPNVGDAGGGVGAALYLLSKQNNKFDNLKLSSPYLGSSYSNEYIKFEIIEALDLNESKTISYKYKENFQDIYDLIAKELTQNKIIGWFQDKAEFGPRALGNRSLLGDPRNPNIQLIINEKIKKREEFRPFAPVIMEDHYKDFFHQKYPSPYMNFVFKAKEKALNEIPGVVHVDGTSRVQTVNFEQNEKLYNLLKSFKKITDVPVLLNTSLNINEPINNDPKTAYETFTKSNIDILVMQNYVFFKK